jgi:hypothetical protein
MIHPTLPQLNAAIAELRSELTAMSGLIDYNAWISDAQMLTTVTKVLTVALNAQSKGTTP